MVFYYKKSVQLSGLALIVLLIFSCRNSIPEESQKPNIIFILADDLGYGDLGCYGQKMIKTPYLDQMASQGLRFTNHYAGSTVCAPSRSALMTGMDTGHTFIRGNAAVPLRPEDKTVAEMLKTAGYKTGLVGKWGLGDQETTGIPNRQGFDFFFGYLNQIRAHNSYPDYLWRNEDKELLPNEIILATDGYAKGIGSVSSNKLVHSHDLFTKEAQQFINKNADNSFFLYLAYTIPHANNEYYLLDDHGMEVPDLGEYEKQDWPEVEKAKAAMISRLDADIGKILNQLHDKGLSKNTLVIFSSDNGPHAEGTVDPEFFDSNNPFRGIKRDLYDGGIRVPLIAWWPGRIKAGTSNHLSSFWDFLPTCAEIAGLEVSQKINGISYLPTLLGDTKNQKKHDYLYWEFPEQGKKQSILQENWKLIYLKKENKYELYDLSQDSGEEADVIDQYPEIFEKLRSKMEKARTPNEFFEF
jgi:uncharacterized sulfatase